jgi:hypothetical protein
VKPLRPSVNQRRHTQPYAPALVRAKAAFHSPDVYTTYTPDAAFRIDGGGVDVSLASAYKAQVVS